MSVERALERALDVLARKPSGFLADIDGTLSEIAISPERAVVADDIRNALEHLAMVVDVVGVISGRSVDDARRMVRLNGLIYSGNHGMERWHRGEYTMETQAARYIEAVAGFTDQISNILADPGILVENKQLTASIHFRRAANPQRAEADALPKIREIARRHDLRVTRGRLVVEARPPIERDKGTSLIDIIADFDLEGVIFIGDDVTDVDAFRALRQWRETTGNAGLAVGVTGDETPRDVLEYADVTVSGVSGARWLISSLYQRLNRPRS